jgi:ATP-dependent DNA helicase RecQ
MQAFVRGEQCLMEFVARELDDELAKPCGRCSACSGPLKPVDVDPEIMRSAVAFLKGDVRHVEMKKQLPAGFRGHPTRRSIPLELMPQPAIVLGVYGDAGWGQYVKDGKYRDGRFSDELVEATALLLLGSQRPNPFPEWVTAVPSLRHSDLVAGFAQRLAKRLDLEFRLALVKLEAAEEQKSMQNSLHQAQNVDRSTRIDRAAIRTGPVFLVDDLIDSAWTLTICGMKLRYAGSGAVFPVALAQVAGDAS